MSFRALSSASSAVRSVRAVSQRRALVPLAPVASAPIHTTATATAKAAHRLGGVSRLRPACRSCSVGASRRYASSTPHGDPGVDSSIPVRDLTDNEYHDLADRDMDVLHESLEVLCEDYGAANWEIEYSSGVMTLTLPGVGTYVINKQPPNHQIWVSSPISGPARFSYGAEGEKWVHHRIAGVNLGALLDSELKTVLKEHGGEEGWEGTGLE